MGREPRIKTVVLPHLLLVEKDSFQTQFSAKRLESEL